MAAYTVEDCQAKANTIRNKPEYQALSKTARTPNEDQAFQLYELQIKTWDTRAEELRKTLPAKESVSAVKPGTKARSAVFVTHTNTTGMPISRTPILPPVTNVSPVNKSVTPGTGKVTGGRMIEAAKPPKVDITTLTAARQAAGLDPHVHDQGESDIEKDQLTLAQALAVQRGQTTYTLSQHGSYIDDLEDLTDFTKAELKEAFEEEIQPLPEPEPVLVKPKAKMSSKPRKTKTGGN